MAVSQITLILLLAEDYFDFKFPFIYVTKDLSNLETVEEDLRQMLSVFVRS